MKCFLCDKPAVDDGYWEPKLCAEHHEQMARCGLCGGDRDNLEIYELDDDTGLTYGPLGALVVCSWCSADLVAADQDVLREAVCDHLAAKGYEMTPGHSPRAKYLAGLRAALIDAGVIVDAPRVGPSPHDQLVGSFVKELRATPVTKQPCDMSDQELLAKMFERKRGVDPCPANTARLAQLSKLSTLLFRSS